MSQTARKLGYTWNEYRQWPDGERWELIDGEAHEKSDTLRSPAFSTLRLALSEVFDFPLEPGEEPPARVREPPPHYSPT